MATPVLACGLECGTLPGAGSTAGHFGILTGAPAISTTTVRTGARAVRCNAAGATVTVQVDVTGAGLRHVGRYYVRFATLPSADTQIHTLGNALPGPGPGVRFQQSDSKLYAAVGTTLGASGVSVTTGVWYRIDFNFLIVTGGANDTADVQVDGSACGQATAAGDNAATTQHIFGVISAVTADVFFDDFLFSVTSGDYPLGAGHVNSYIPNADGTHNIAGAADFKRGAAGTDITNASTTAWDLVDDRPLPSSVVANDYINMIAPPNATDYVELRFEAESVETAGPRAVEVIAAIHQAGTGAGNMELRLNDNGTMGTIYTATGVAGTTTLTYKRAHFADPPSAATAWVLGGAGNGDFNDVRVRFGSPGAVDANPDQYLDAIMIEAEFADPAGNVTVTPGVIALVTAPSSPQANMGINAASPTALLTSLFAPQLRETLTPAALALVLATFAPDPRLGPLTATPTTASLITALFAPQLKETLTPGVASLATSAFAPQLKETLTPSTLALLLASFAPQLQESLTPSALALLLTTFAPSADIAAGGTTVTPDTLALTLSTFAVQLQETLTPALLALALTTFLPTVTATANGLVTPDTLALLLTSFAPQLRESLTVGLLALTLATFAPQLRTGVTPTALALALGSFAPQLQERITPTQAALALSTFAAQLQETLTPSTASLTLTAFTPQLREVLTVGLVALALSTFAPDVRTGANVVPTTVALTTASFAPQLRELLTVGLAALTLTAFAPDLNQPTTLTPTTLALTLATFAASLRESIPVSPASLALLTQSPSLLEQLTVGNAALILSTFAPILPVLATVGVASLVTAGFAPQLREVLTPDPQGLILTPFTPNVINSGVGVVATPGPASLILITFVPDVSRTITEYIPGAPFPPVPRLYLHQIGQDLVRRRSID